jgi:hypothetical protein
VLLFAKPGVGAVIKEQRKVLLSPDQSHLLMPQLGWIPLWIFPPQAFRVLGCSRDLAVTPVPNAMLG